MVFRTSNVEPILIDAARNGNRQAQAEVLRALQDHWFRFCLGLLRNDDAAREATQETAYRFLRDLRKYRGESSLKTWSLGIALNVVRELRRRRRLDNDLQDRPGADDPLEQAADAESAAAIRTILDDLPERQREAVVLRFFEQLSVEETADAMNCAQGTVKATVHQALRFLKEKLKAYR